MSIISSLSEADIEKRFYTLPDDIQNLLGSAKLKQTVAALGTSFEISAEKIPYINAVVAAVFMGFIDCDAVIGELMEFLGVDQPKAIAMEDKVYAQIFASHRDMIDAIYAVNNPEENSTIPTPTLMPSLAATVPAGPTLNLRVAPAPLPTAGASFEMRAASIPPVPKPTMPTSPLASSTSHLAPSAAPAPFILQKSTAAETVVKDSGFRLNLDPKLFGGGPSRPVVPPPPKAARLELGATPVPKSQTSPTTPSNEPQRIVHYTAPIDTSGIKAAPLPQAAEPMPKSLEQQPAPVLENPPAKPAIPSSPLPVSKTVPTLDLRPRVPAAKPEPPANLPVSDAHPVLNLKKEDTTANNSQFSATHS